MGRPVGSKNKKTLEREAAAAAAVEEGEVGKTITHLEVAEVPEVAPEMAPEPEMVVSEPEPEPMSPAPAPKRVRAPRAPKAPKVPKAPRPAERAPRERAAPAPPAVPDAPHFSLLDVIKQGLKQSRQQHKAERVARYDSFFAY